MIVRPPGINNPEKRFIVGYAAVSTALRAAHVAGFEEDEATYQYLPDALSTDCFVCEWPGSDLIMTLPPTLQILQPTVQAGNASEAASQLNQDRLRFLDFAAFIRQLSGMGIYMTEPSMFFQSFTAGIRRELFFDVFRGRKEMFNSCAAPDCNCRI